MTENNQRPPYDSPFVSIVGNAPYLFVELRDGYILKEESKDIDHIKYRVVEESSTLDNRPQLTQFGSITIISSNGTEKKIRLNKRKDKDRGVNYEEHPFIYTELNEEGGGVIHFLSFVPQPEKWKMNRNESPGDTSYELNLKAGEEIDEAGYRGLYYNTVDVEETLAERTSDDIEFGVSRANREQDPKKRKKVLVNTSNGSVGEDVKEMK